MARLARTNRTDNNHAGSSSGEDTEQDTPKPPRQGLKKRISDAYTPANDASFTSEGGRLPLQSVNINDDAAEKRRRRKSTKVPMEQENAQAGPSTEGDAGTNGTDVSRTTKQKPHLRTVDAPPAIKVSLDVMNSNFEEWMKMATDNKINAANSWNFALIDYFHDMSLLRNNSDNSINFQRASCTLDGCVKIWTSRVDSVGTETGKLLSNLANEGRGGDSDDEGAGSDNPDAQDPSQQRKKTKSHRPESTLARDAAQLKTKKLELDFSVDPLFRKTCADFDEGGAQGLLMNHLSLGVGSDGGLRVVFDASDSLARRDEEEEEPQEPEEEVDLSYLRGEFMPDLEILENRAISHSLADFSFSKDAFAFDETTFLRDNTPAAGDNEDDDDAMLADFGAPTLDQDGTASAPAQDFFVGDQAVDDDYGGGGDFGGPDDFDGDGGAESVGAAGELRAEAGGGGGRSGTFVPFDPRRIPNERDLVLAMTDEDGEGGMMNYFDQNFLKNWAGPEHWKLRKVVRRPEAPETAAAPKKREKKDPFKIDFTSPSEKDLKKTVSSLFAPAPRGASITLPGASSGKGRGRKGKRGAENEKKDEYKLPDDMHFSSRQLVTLFLKPKFSLKMRGQRSNSDDNGGEVDENYWARAAAPQGPEEGDETENGGAIPFNTQFFHDDYDDGPGFDDAYDGEGDPAAILDDAGEQDLLAATQGQTRRVRPEAVNYAKRAKRVDVRKLKENIWRGLDIKVEEKADDAMDTDEPAADAPSEAREFRSVITDLQKSYPPEKMQEISTSFCFICLLHLANEQGLKLEGASEAPPEEQPEHGVEEVVGKLWELKVSKDPHATPAA